MKLHSLCVENYRNIRAAEFTPGEELTVLCGENGQGKTNLLEAVWLLTGSKSFRNAKDAQLIQEGEAFAVVQGSAECGGLEKEIRITVAGESCEKKGRRARMNGVEYARAASIAGTFTAVVFDPGHLSLVKGSPDGRRRFLDAALCQLYPGYLSLLRKYTRLVTQKNALLKNYYATFGGAELLDIFDEKLSEAGQQVSERRRAYLELLAPLVRENYRDISQGREEMEICYLPSYDSRGLACKLKETRSRDIAAGFCTAGPHREDFDIILSGKQAKLFASQGQQRSAVLSLKLAEAAAADTALFCYEKGGAPLHSRLAGGNTIAIVTGSEGGFSPEEAQAAVAAGLVPVGLGPRILRCETAPLAALAVTMALTGNLQ